MLSGSLSSKEDGMIYHINDELRLIYGLGAKESIQYIFDYYLKELYIEYEQPVKMIRKYFTNSFN
jgi:hypothetical protein